MVKTYVRRFLPDRRFDGGGAVVTLLDRLTIRNRRDRRALADYHRHAQDLKRDTMLRRRELGAAFLAANPGHPIIDPALGMLTVRLTGALEAVKEARALIETGAADPTRNKVSLDFFARGPDFEQDSAAVRLAFAPEILAPAIGYFGVLPVLVDIVVTRPAAAELRPETTHAFHADPDDITNLKVFIHLSDVDEDCGPFHALPAYLTQKAEPLLDYPRGRIPDEDVARIVGEARAVPSLGPVGTATFCDTTRCYHFGARPAAPGTPPRDQLVLRYVLPTSTLFPQVPGDGETIGGMAQLRPNGDPVWDAVIGAALI